MRRRPFSSPKFLPNRIQSAIGRVVSRARSWLSAVRSQTFTQQQTAQIIEEETARFMDTNFGGLDLSSFPLLLTMSTTSLCFWVNQSTRYAAASWHRVSPPQSGYLAGILLSALQQGPFEERLQRLEATLGLGKGQTDMVPNVESNTTK